MQQNETECRYIPQQIEIILESFDVLYSQNEDHLRSAATRMFKSKSCADIMQLVSSTVIGMFLMGKISTFFKALCSLFI